ncbi:hypothetical protein [Fulvivirga imtechensis]|uniref:hypothetical protein n=1 Tax=Fulvivirga imtechensis TaxID=881893 RepID=UPI0005905C31|nr:hypothetical protein [Fulvivirga imtechensis]
MTKKGQYIFLWMLILLLCLQFLFSGFMRLAGENIDFAIWGWSCTFIFYIGWLDIMIAVGLLIGRVRIIATLILMLSMCFQGYVYFLHDEIAFVMLDLASAGLALIVLWYSRENLHVHV